MVAALFGTVLTLLAVSSPASAITNLTESQVRNVCGSDLKKTPGHIGCTKKCADRQSTCIYDCSEKTKVCSGVAMGGASTAGDSKGASAAKQRH